MVFATLACLRNGPARVGVPAVGVITLLARDSTRRSPSAWPWLSRAVPVRSSPSIFPAIFLTTMVALWVAQGEAVPSGAVGP